MMSSETEEQSACKREVQNLTDEEAALFLKLVKLVKNPTIAKQFTS